jgi:exosome complex component RRP42
MSITPPSEAVADIERERIAELVSRNERIDGRDLLSYREIKVETGTIERAQGSALVSIGDTKVLAAVKASLGKPYADTPNEGMLVVNVDLVPFTSQKFERGLDENSVELARIVDRGLRGANAVDLSKLCLVPGEKAFAIYLDVCALNNNGNLVDALVLACSKALSEAKLPRYEVEGGEVKEVKGEFTRLPVKNLPVSVTTVKLGERLVVDPLLVEENLADTKISILIDQRGNTCGIQKSGVGLMATDAAKEAMRIARERAADLKKIIGL